MKNDWRYIFDLFYRHSPGFIELYQENCRIYLDEYPKKRYMRYTDENGNIYIFNIDAVAKYQKEFKDE